MGLSDPDNGNSYISEKTVFILKHKSWKRFYLNQSEVMNPSSLRWLWSECDMVSEPEPSTISITITSEWRAQPPHIAIEDKLCTQH